MRSGSREEMWEAEEVKKKVESGAHMLQSCDRGSHPIKTQKNFWSPSEWWSILHFEYLVLDKILKQQDLIENDHLRLHEEHHSLESSHT